MGVYDRQKAQAQRLIAAKGEACTWKQAQAPTVADPTKPWIATNAAPVTHAVKIVFVSGSSPFLMLLMGSSVEAGKLKAIMASVGFMPTLSDSVVRSDGTLLQLDSIEPLAPNGDTIIWRLTFKR